MKKLSNLVKSLLKIHTCRPPSWITRDVIVLICTHCSYRSDGRNTVHIGHISERKGFLSEMWPIWTVFRPSDLYEQFMLLNKKAWLEYEEEYLDSFVCSRFPPNFRLSPMTLRIIQDGSLHVCIFDKDFTRLESYFKIEFWVESYSPHELCHFGVNFPFKNLNIFRSQCKSLHPEQTYVTIVTQICHASHVNMAELAVIGPTTMMWGAWAYSRFYDTWLYKLLCIPVFQRNFALQSSLWRKIENWPMPPLTSRSWV